jgi:PAS domain S-box-containing protein
VTDSLQNPGCSEALIQCLPEGIIVVNEAGQITFLNQSAERITGWVLADALGKSIDEVLHLATGRELFSEYLAQPASLRPPVNVTNRHGQDVTLSVATSCFDSTGADSPRTAIIIRDVTAEDTTQKLRSYFLANISHEFRTPLAALKASVELLLEGVREFSLDETLELARSIHLSVTSLQTLIDNLLESVSIEAGRFRVRRKLTDLNVVVAEAKLLMKPLLERRNQALVTDIPQDLPRVNVDPMRMTQVLVNLLSNASKYGPIDQPIEVCISLEPNDLLKVSVTDRGTGIFAEDKANVFRRFVRLEQKDQAQYGIGLGLSVVKTIVESHGGAVGLDERPGGGSVFWFTIPTLES